MKEQHSKQAVGRRDFLRVLAAGAGAAAAGAPLSAGAQPKESDDVKRKARYRESDHVKAFYRVNRYPAK
jgi:hypothetical protein